MIYYKKFQILKKRRGYPFTPLLLNTDEISFDSPITIINGENASGKTTLARLISECTGCISIAPAKTQIDVDSECFRVVKTGFPKRKFYFSAEDFIGYIKEFERMRAENAEMLRQVNESKEYGSEYAKALASMPYASSLNDMEAMYKGKLLEMSHGEGFSEFFTSRLKSDGFYILDEPEGALSFYNQFATGHAILNAVKNHNCQFVLFTHSPVLSALPYSRLYQIKEERLCETEWENLDSTVFLKMFMARGKSMFDL